MTRLFLYSIAFTALLIVPDLALAQDSTGISVDAPVSVSPAEPAAPVVSGVVPDAAITTASNQIPPGVETSPVSQMLPAVPSSPIEKGIGDQIRLLDPQINVNLMPSLFYSTWEHDLLIDARRGITTGSAIVDEASFDPAEAITGPRDISLSGIVYVSSKDWTIWLNGIRVTPKAIPEAVMDLKVFKEYIELDWFDTSTNQIFPIRLRSHQRFNLDTRIFLPG